MSQAFEGTIENVRYFDKGLSLEEVRWIYQHPNTVLVLDKSGNGSHGVFVEGTRE